MQGASVVTPHSHGDHNTPSDLLHLQCRSGAQAAQSSIAERLAHRHPKAVDMQKGTFPILTPCTQLHPPVAILRGPGGPDPSVPAPPRSARETFARYSKLCTLRCHLHVPKEIKLTHHPRTELPCLVDKSLSWASPQHRELGRGGEGTHSSGFSPPRSEVL